MSAEDDSTPARSFVRSDRQNVRILRTNLDIFQRQVVECPCGTQIDRRTGWFTMIADGSLLCLGCSTCSRCKASALTSSRKIVSIDGMNMCNKCLADFGHFVVPEQPIRVDPELLEKIKKSQQIALNGGKQQHQQQQQQQQQEQLEEQQQPEAEAGAGEQQENANAIANQSAADSTSQQNAVGEDGRKPLRKRNYKKPENIYNVANDPTRTPLPYLAKKENLEAMACPVCTQPAYGPESIILAGTARVYHKTCVRCSSCSRQMLELPMVLPNVHFRVCTCYPAQMWCLRDECVEFGDNHHKEKSCKLMSVHPGGRY